MNKCINKIIAATLALTSIVILKPVKAEADWQSDSNGWFYVDGVKLYTGWKLINNQWYYFYSDGYMAHDTTIDGYYLNSDGAWVSSIKDRMIGKWYGLKTDTTVPGLITSETIEGCNYKIVQENSDYIILEVYNKHGSSRKYKFTSYTENTMMMYWYDESNKDYVGGILLTRA